MYCLLVGVDAYGPPVDLPLNGCVNDVRHLEQYLRGRLGDAAQILTLADGQATREGVVAGFRSHLAQAGKGDIALFSYSGHGSQELPPTEFALRRRVGQDPEPAVVRRRARRRRGSSCGRWPTRSWASCSTRSSAGGAHVVAMLDCCHSGDGTRDAFVTARQWIPTSARDADPASASGDREAEGPAPARRFSGRYVAALPDDDVDRARRAAPRANPRSWRRSSSSATNTGARSRRR